MSYPKFQAKEFPEIKSPAQKKKDYVPDATQVRANELGKVRMFNPSKGWGFIFYKNDAGKIMDVFLHTKHFVNPLAVPKVFVGHDKNSPEEKQQKDTYVLYDLDLTNPNKPQALKVNIVDEKGNPLPEDKPSTPPLPTVKVVSPKLSVASHESVSHLEIEKSVRFEESDEKLFLPVANLSCDVEDDEDDATTTADDPYTVSYFGESARSLYDEDYGDDTPMSFMATPMNWPSYGHPHFPQSPYTDHPSMYGHGMPSRSKTPKTSRSAKTPRMHMDPMQMQHGMMPMHPFGPMPMQPGMYPNMYGVPPHMFGMHGFCGMPPLPVGMRTSFGQMPMGPPKMESRKSLKPRKSQRKSLKSIHEQEDGYRAGFGYDPFSGYN